MISILYNFPLAAIGIEMQLQFVFQTPFTYVQWKWALSCLRDLLQVSFAFLLSQRLGNRRNTVCARIECLLSHDEYKEGTAIHRKISSDPKHFEAFLERKMKYPTSKLRKLYLFVRGDENKGIFTAANARLSEPHTKYPAASKDPRNQKQSFRIS